VNNVEKIGASRGAKMLTEIVKSQNGAIFGVIYIEDDEIWAMS